MRWMPRMNCERLHFDGKHYDLAAFTRKVVSENEKGLFFEETKRPCEATPHNGAPSFEKGRFLLDQKAPARQRPTPEPPALEKLFVF